jgi:PAS domain S-box-containing protein
MARISVDISGIWEQVYHASPIGITIVSVAGNFIQPNQTLCKILGRTKEELEACSWEQITHPDDLEKDKDLVLEVLLNQRDAYQLDKRYYRPDGSIVFATLSVSCDRNTDGRVNYFISQILDNGANEFKKQLEKEKYEEALIFKESVIEAIENDNFILHYQEIIDLETLEAAGYESLLRWDHREKGLLFPNDFIYRIEADPELMLLVCEWVFLRAIKDKKLLKGFLSINVSPVSLLHPEFLSTIAMCEDSRDCPVIYLEITERSALEYISDDQILKQIDSYKYGVFVDDFGQGHSGLVQVIRLLNAFRDRASIKVKIDIWFTQRIADPSVQYAMAGLISMIHGLGIEVIAEGIETKEQLEIWQKLKCDFGQGWLWGKAKPI